MKMGKLRTCKLWDTSSGKCIDTFRGHNDEVLDACFNSTGNRLATAGADGMSRVYNVFTGNCIGILFGIFFLIQAILEKSQKSASTLKDLKSSRLAQTRLAGYGMLKVGLNYRFWRVRVSFT